MGSRLKRVFRDLARANQQAGGHFKGSSKLTEASVRKRIADEVGVCEGNVTKVEQLLNSEPEVLDALARGEIRIHRAWVWRRLSRQQQREDLRLYRLKAKSKAIGQDTSFQASSEWLSNGKPNLGKFNQPRRNPGATAVHAAR
jgi:hypothetical protein